MVPEHDTTTIRVNRDSKQELQQLGSYIDASSFAEVIDHLLEEQYNFLTLDEVLERAFEAYDFDDVACIYAEHPISDNFPTFVDITLYSGEASMDETVDTVSPMDRLEVEYEGETTTCDVMIRATCDGPKDWDHKGGTPIYMAESVMGSEPIALEDGKEHLKGKLLGKVEPRGLPGDE